MMRILPPVVGLARRFIRDRLTAMATRSKFARRVFLAAGIYGLVVLLPQYFVELGLPALIERPEHFYGFIGVASRGSSSF